MQAKLDTWLNHLKNAERPRHSSVQRGGDSAGSSLTINGISKFPVLRARGRMIVRPSAARRSVAFVAPVQDSTVEFTHRDGQENVVAAAVVNCAGVAPGSDDDVDDVPLRRLHGSDPSIELNLWKTKPPRTCQYLCLESEHMPGDISSGTSGSDDT